MYAYVFMCRLCIRRDPMAMPRDMCMRMSSYVSWALDSMGSECIGFCARNTRKKHCITRTLFDGVKQAQISGGLAIIGSSLVCAATPHEMIQPGKCRARSAPIAIRPSGNYEQGWRSRDYSAEESKGGQKSGSAKLPLGLRGIGQSQLVQSQWGKTTSGGLK